MCFECGSMRQMIAIMYLKGDSYLYTCLTDFNIPAVTLCIRAYVVYVQEHIHATFPAATELNVFINTSLHRLQ